MHWLNVALVLDSLAEVVERMYSLRLVALAAFVLLFVPAMIAGQDSNERQLAPASTALADADVTPPRVTHSPDPKYPKEARDAGHQGTSILSFMVGTDGYAHDINVVRKLDAQLDESAVAAVGTLRFKPARKGDTPVEVRIQTRIRFRLMNGSNRQIAELWDRADKSDPKADLALWKNYLEGNGVPQDTQLALWFLKQAADWNLSEAQFQMGEHFYRDQRPPDYVKAYMWYALSKRAGSKQGESMLSVLASEMSPEQLSEADTRVEYWPEEPPKGSP